MLAGWWRQLASHKPQRLWFIDWLVHRFEVLSRCRRTEALHPLQLLILEGIRLDSAGEAANSHSRIATAKKTGYSTNSLQPTSSTAIEIARRLGLDNGVVSGLLLEAVRNGLAEASFEGGCALTEAGRAALASGHCTRVNFERRAFYVGNEPATFLPLTRHGHATSISEMPPAPLEVLRACVDRPLEWKEKVGFPSEVVSIMDMSTTLPPNTEYWMRIPVDHPERLLAAMIRTTDGRVLAFPVRTEDWTLRLEPVMNLSSDGSVELLPHLSHSVEDWRRPWSNWCRTIRGISAAEAESATLEVADHRLLVKAPQLADRLRLARSELSRGEAWLLSGGSQTREALQIELRG
jgi:hypothetical protein